MLFLLVYLLSTTDSFAGADSNIELKVGISPIVSYVSKSRTTNPTLNSFTGLRYCHFLKENLGIFGGVDFQIRGIELIGGSQSSPLFVDFPFGVAFRHHGVLGFEQALGIVKLGGLLTRPMSSLRDYDDSVVAQNRLSFGVLFESAAYFPLNEFLQVGPTFGIKYGIGHPFESKYPSLDSISSFIEINGGLSFFYSF